MVRLALDGLLHRMSCLCIEDFVRLADVDFAVRQPYCSKPVIVCRLHSTTVDIAAVVLCCTVVLSVAVLTVAVTRIEHYYLRSNYRMVEQSAGIFIDLGNKNRNKDRKKIKAMLK